MAQVFNSVYCPTANGVSVGTGTKNCKIDLNEIKIPVLIERGTTFGTVDSPDLVDLDYIRNLQLLGKAVIYPKGYSFTQNVNEDSTEENPDTGALRVTRVNPYDFNLMFENGAAWNKAAYCYNSYDQWDLIWFDKNGTFVCTTSKSGVLKGFSLGMFQVSQYTFGQGTNNAKNNLRIQLPITDEFNKRVSWIESDDLDFDPLTELDGVNDITITAVAPANADTSVVFSVVDVSKNVPSTEFTAADIRVLVNGVADAGALAYDNNGTYTKTVAALTNGDIITIQIYDTTENVARKVVGECVFQSNEAQTITT